MVGTPSAFATRDTCQTAEAWPRPTAQTSCVVQIEPEPMPTRSASAPASQSVRACLPVTTLPQMTSILEPCALFRCASISIW